MLYLITLGNVWNIPDGLHEVIGPSLFCRFNLLEINELHGTVIHYKIILFIDWFVGYCLEFSEGNVTRHSCNHFSYGCPETYFYDYEIYKCK